MTVVCGGGTSSAQAGFGDFIYMAPAAVGALLNNIPTVWAVPLAAYIGHVEYELVTFCQTDPPPVPTFTAADVAALFNPFVLTEFLDARNKLRQLVGAYLWYQVCKCDSVTTPAPPTPPTAPPGMPSINPPAVSPSYPTGQACSTFDYGMVHVTGTFTGPNPTIPVGGVTYVVLDILEQSRAASSLDHVFFQIVFRSSAGASLGTPCTVGINTSGGPPHSETAVPSGTVALQFQSGDTTSLGGAIDVHAFANLYCGTTPGGGTGSAPAPCATDPFVLGLLDEILALVTLIQRQAAPFAYVSGTAHAGLSGNGSLTVHGLLGAKIQVTNLGFNTGQQLGDPDVLWQAGWVNWGNADGVSERQWITAEILLTLPSLAGQYTALHYSLEPGVAVTITELEREP